MNASAGQARSLPLLKRLFGYVRPHWSRFLLSVMAMAVIAATEPAVAALMAPLVDGTFVNRDPDAILMVPLALVGLYFVRGAARVLATLGLTSVATQVVMKLRLDLFEQVQLLPQSFMDRTTSGQLLSRITFDVTQLADAASKVWLVLVRDSLMVIGLIGYMFWLNWRLAILVLACAPVIALIVRLVSKAMRKNSHQIQEQMGHLTHRLEESLKGHRLIKLYQAERQETEKFFRVSNRLRQTTLKLTVLGAANSPVVQFVIAIALASVIYIAATLEGDSAMTPGQFVSFFTAMGMLFAPIRSLTSVNEPLQRGLAAADTLFGLLDQPREDQHSGQDLERPFTGSVRIEGLRFRYQPDQPPVLDGIDLDIRPGETVALVGHSGSGKSTLTQLIARFYPPESGRILFDGVDIATLKLSALRRMIAYVDQDTFLFNDTVAANVALGDPEGVDEARVIEALRHAHALEFVQRLEQGIHTSVGEQGSLLSGGQRQRIALARAFYKNAPLLILDEATSALDNESERQVQAALEEITAGRTTIVIAHRLSTIERADRILVMQAGRIVESGTHAELLAADGLYRQLHREVAS